MRGTIPRPGRFGAALVRWAAAVLAGCLLVALPVAAAGELVLALDGRITVEDGRTILRVTLSRPVSPAVLMMEGPDRILLDLPGTRLQIGEPVPAKGGLVASVRAGQLAPDRGRVVLALGAPAVPLRVGVADGAVPGTWTLALELGRVGRDEFRRRAAVSLDEVVSATGSLGPPPAAVETRPVVVLDAGHGGTDPGARATNGLVEKDLTLAFVGELRDRLLATGRYRVALTREDDTFVPLDERVARARAVRADLFLSFHADSISSASVRGATIYTGAERATDPDSAGLAERENAADRAGGHLAAPIPGEVASILQDLTTRETRTFSHRVAARLHEELAAIVRFTVQPHREAAFRVLRAADMPSALVEIGYLSNPRDVSLMFSPEWRKRFGEAVLAGIDGFFGGRRVAGAAVSP